MDHNAKDRISEVLGTATGINDHSLVKNEQAPENVETYVDDMVAIREKNRNQDYEFARTNIQNAIIQGAALIPTVVAVAREAENPKMFEATAHFLKALSDLNRDLVELSDEPKVNQKRQEKKSEEQKKPEAPKNISQTNIYVRSTDLLEAALAKKKALDEKTIEGDFDEIDAE